jgi:DNA invertase Pin-like site-specific DNA recombinase
MNKCVIITRVSSIEQVENHSLDSQEKACRDYAERNGLDVVEVFRIEGESAKGTVRPEFQKAVDWSTRNAKELGITHLVLYKLDRWARSAESHALLWGQLKGAGVKLCSTTEEIDESAFGNFLTTLAVAMAQLDNDQRSERTKVGMKAAAAMGRWTGKPPIGYLRPTDRKMGASLFPDPLRAPLVKMAFERMALGTLSQKEVLDELSVLGLAMRSGKKMTRQRFGALLRNPVYKGRVVHESWATDYPGDFDAIVSDELFDTVNALLDRGDGSGKRRSLNNPDFPLRRFVRCGKCEIGITGSTSKNSKGKSYPYYRCRTKGCGGVSIRQERLHELFEDLLRSHSMTTEALSLFQAVVEQAWDVRSRSQRDLHTGLERRREEVVQDQQSLLEKYIRGEGDEDLGNSSDPLTEIPQLSAEVVCC